MWPALILGGLSAGGSLLSGLGAKQSSAKQARLQKMADDAAWERNTASLAETNARREELGREMLTVPEVHSRQSSTSTQSGNWVDVDAMMAAGERAGFNPSTWLAAGAMQAYQQSWSQTDNDETLTSTGHNAADAFKLMLPDSLMTQASQVPQQSSMLSAFGGALSAGVNAFGTQYRADQSYDLQLAKLLQAGATQGMGLAQNNGLSTALAYGGGGGGFAGNATPSRGLTDMPYPANWERGKVEVTNPYGRAFIDSTSPNAEVGEVRYGDIAQELFGAANLVQDAIRNITGRTVRDWGVAAGMDIGSYKKPADTTWTPAVSRWWNSPTSLPSWVMSAPQAIPNVGYPTP